MKKFGTENISFLDFSKFFSYKVTALQSLKVKNNLSLDENRELILDSLNISSDIIAFPSQVHSNVVKWVEHPVQIQNCDGLLTKTNIPLVIQTADCVPAFIFDNTNKIYGLIHSGWRGTMKKIIPKAINEMVIEGSKISDIIIMLGASIKDCCYEVSDEFINKFNVSCIVKIENKFYFSNSNQIKLDLINIGLNSSQIFISDECTYENNNLCSYRRDGDSAGRMFSIIRG